MSSKSTVGRPRQFDHEAIAKDYQANVLTVAEIAAKYGCTVFTVINASVYSEGGKPRGKIKLNHSAIFEAYLNNVPVSEIAAAHNCHPQTIYALVSRRMREDGQPTTRSKRVVKPAVVQLPVEALSGERYVQWAITPPIGARGDQIRWED